MDQKIEPCYTCRNRRIQCDQSGVPCAKCQKAGLECFDKRPFRWVKGVAIRGKMQGRSFPNSGVPDHDDKKSALISSRQSMIQCAHGQSGSLNFNNFSLNTIPDPSFVLQNPSFLHLDRTSRYYIDYYNERICKLFIVYDSNKNPFRSLISLGLKDPVLLKALLALAARHHVNSGQSFDQAELPTELRLVNANRDALSFKQQAIESLSHYLRDNRNYKQDTIVASIFLLVFLDLIESGSDGWNFHLEGAKKLIASTYLPSGSPAGVNQGPGETLQEIRGFITKQIHLIETLGATFSRPKLLSKSSSFNLQGIEPQETIEKSFLGCPEYLLTAIQCLSAQRDSITASTMLDSVTAISSKEDTASLLKLIQEFDCYAWASGLQQSRDSSPQDTTNLYLLSQAYKLGSLLYGGRVLNAIAEENTAQDDLVSELLGLIDSLKDDPALFKCILWPIFVAGMECQWEAQRTFLPRFYKNIGYKIRQQLDRDGSSTLVI
ncbi:hypothetical protein N7466_010894 [Penicillium verhagenii]|uniref:uncharacterized protein n=1 Tax=Penicillium verhagenii TaxID=1562060 RepID=UPI0025450F4C|nr:uncharacterized protein N7466_010894 [Penicillium verhagenii]KAJ5917340.1 hypothetical protein N7466_010894 [Penicillium verhagenii]